MSAPTKEPTARELAELNAEVQRTQLAREQLTMALVAAARTLRDVVTLRRPRQAINRAREHLFRVVEQQNTASAEFVLARMKREVAVSTVNGGAKK